MPRWFLSKREGKRGGELIDPFVNPERNVELEAARGGAGCLRLRRGGFRRRRWRVGSVCEAFFRMELYADSFRWIFTGRALSKGKSLRVALVEGFAPTAAQVGRFIEFDETSSSHGGHTSRGQSPSPGATSAA